MRSAKVVEEGVAVGWMGGITAEDEMAIDAVHGTGCGGEAAVIGLRSTGGEDRRGSLREGVGEEEFELADFVTTKGEGRLVVALDPDLRPRWERRRETIQFLQGRGVGREADTREVRGDGREVSDRRRGFGIDEC